MERPPEPPPTVSVIVPVRNDAAGLSNLLPALLAQSYPRQRIEILVVDNGSQDESRGLAERFAAAHPGTIRALVEDSVASSYAARNAGLRAASGQILAFTDADCTPAPDWIAAGVRALQDTPADLAGGRVAFTLPPHPSAAALHDAITNLRTAHTITTQGSAATANLFVRRQVVEALGPFPAHLRSGGDAIWTHRATVAGHRLTYAPDALVSHPPRELGPLLRKCARVGRGQPAVWRELGYTRGRAALALVGGLRPRSTRRLRAMAAERGIVLTRRQMVAVWGVAWLCGLATTGGRVRGYLARGR